jgi:4-amino-4-deoxy-L-arabinose transferase-like glycosyltransferase
MSQETSRHSWYFVSGLLALSVAGQAIHWFITPASISASNGRWWAVVAQAVIGTAVAVWFFVRARQLRREN